MLPNDEYPVPKVAGNYGPASNIWAIGMVIQSQQVDLGQVPQLIGNTGLARHDHADASTRPPSRIRPDEWSRCQSDARWDPVVP